MPRARSKDESEMSLKQLIQRTDFQQGFSKEGAELLSRLWVPVEEDQQQQQPQEVPV
jgi:hypothetical protein